MAGQQRVPGDDRLLGRGRPPEQTEPCRHRTLVHLRVLGEPGLLGMLSDHPVECLDILQRPAHQHRVGHAVAIVGEHPHRRRRRGHRAQFGETGTAQPLGDRADRAHITVPGGLAEPPDLFHHASGVRDRLGVGHREHGGETAQCRSPGA